VSHLFIDTSAKGGDAIKPRPSSNDWSVAGGVSLEMMLLAVNK